MAPLGPSAGCCLGQLRNLLSPLTLPPGAFHVPLYTFGDEGMGVGSGTGENGSDRARSNVRPHAVPSRGVLCFTCGFHSRGAFACPEGPPHTQISRARQAALLSPMAGSEGRNISEARDSFPSITPIQATVMTKAPPIRGTRRAVSSSHGQLVVFLPHVASGTLQWCLSEAFSHQK